MATLEHVRTELKAAREARDRAIARAAAKWDAWISELESTEATILRLHAENVAKRMDDENYVPPAWDAGGGGR